MHNLRITITCDTSGFIASMARIKAMIEKKRSVLPPEELKRIAENKRECQKAKQIFQSMFSAQETKPNRVVKLAAENAMVTQQSQLEHIMQMFGKQTPTAAEISAQFSEACQNNVSEKSYYPLERMQLNLNKTKAYRNKIYQILPK